MSPGPDRSNTGFFLNTQAYTQQRQGVGFGKMRPALPTAASMTEGGEIVESGAGMNVSGGAGGDVNAHASSSGIVSNTGDSARNASASAPSSSSFSSSTSPSLSSTAPYYGGTNGMMANGYSTYRGYGGQMGYSGMGYGMGGMGLMGMGGVGGYFGWIYSLQSAMYSLGALMEFTGIAVQGIVHVTRQLYYKFHQFRYTVMRSDTRQWLQRKCKKSRILRWLLIFGASALTNSAINLIKYLLKLQQRGNLIEGGGFVSGQQPGSSSVWSGEFAAGMSHPSPSVPPRMSP